MSYAVSKCKLTSRVIQCIRLTNTWTLAFLNLNTHSNCKWLAAGDYRMFIQLSDYKQNNTTWSVTVKRSTFKAMSNERVAGNTVRVWRQADSLFHKKLHRVGFWDLGPCGQWQAMNKLWYTRTKSCAKWSLWWPSFRILLHLFYY